MSDEQARAALMARIEDAVSTRMREKRRRWQHTQGVADTAEELARAYGADPFSARAAGLLHDWDKVLPDAELAARAAAYGICVEGPISKAVHLLHGPVAARELPNLFPELDPSVFQAVARHTVGATDMTPLDMVVYVADAIEPGRGPYADGLRSQVGEASLEGLFLACAAQSMSYVIQERRYLYPPAVAVYNAYLERAGAR